MVFSYIPPMLDRRLRYTVKMCLLLGLPLLAAWKLAEWMTG